MSTIDTKDTAGMNLGARDTSMPGDGASPHNPTTVFRRPRPKSRKSVSKPFRGLLSTRSIFPQKRRDYELLSLRDPRVAASGFDSENDSEADTTVDSPVLDERIAPRKRKRNCNSCCVAFTSGCCVAVGVMLLIINVLPFVGRCLWYSTHDPDSVFNRWGMPGTGTEMLSWYPTDFLRDVVPIPVHSHNDYWRKVPLFSAIHVGCTSVEADVWHFDGDNELYVGHNRAALTPDRTFTALYVNPLVELLNRTNPTTRFYKADNESCANGIFDMDRKQTLVLLIDLKTDGAATWPLVLAQLEPLRSRGWLSHVREDGEVVLGPVTVVGTGNTPFEGVMQNGSFRDVFFDAPIDSMYEDEHADPGLSPWDTYNTSNSFLASADINRALGNIWYVTGGITEFQKTLLRGQIRGAHRRGLKIRYWNLPAWPRRYRNEIWRLLLEEGVDYLNVDDIKGVSRFNLPCTSRRRWAHNS